MPKGERTISWTPDNDAKLLLTIVALENVRPDLEKVAAAFGGNVNATAIQSRLKRLRKMAVDSGINKYAASQEGSSPAKANGRALAGNKKTSTNRKRGGMLNDDASDTGVNDASAMDDESDDGTRAPSPSRKGQKVIGGRVHKARVPPRNTGKKTEHKKLDDPVVAMDNADDEEGNNVASGPESEDRLTLRESEGEKKEAVIKGEEAV